MLEGRSRELGLGPLTDVSLAEARKRAAHARQLLLDGRDPIEAKREIRNAAKAERLHTMTFEQAATEFLRTTKIANLKSERHRRQWRSTLEQYAFPIMGDLPLQSIDAAIVLRVVSPVLERIPETGSRLRGRIERVFAWAKPLGLFVGDNPASRDVLKDHLPARPKVAHHAALPYAELPAFMDALRARESVSARALELTILTATRTSETIGAQWSELDLEAGVWTVPAARMKAKRDHRVPLSPRAVELLRALPRLGDFVFINGGGRPLSNMAMLELVRGVRPGLTVHGFRSTFSDWARDRTNYARDVIEQALAHIIKDKSEAAYRRGDALDKRRRLMAEWSRYCESRPAAAGDVIPLRA